MRLIIHYLLCTFCAGGVIPGTTFSSCANQCNMTCMSLTSPESCNDDDSECEPGCVCPSGTVLDVVAEECVVPEACSCYDFVCDSYIENGAANASTCCPERQWYVSDPILPILFQYIFITIWKNSLA